MRQRKIRTSFFSVYLQPSNAYMEETNIHQAAEEIFINAGIVDRKVVKPHVIEDAILLHHTIVEDLKQQLDEIGMSSKHLSAPTSQRNTRRFGKPTNVFALCLPMRSKNYSGESHLNQFDV